MWSIKFLVSVCILDRYCVPLCSLFLSGRIGRIVFRNALELQDIDVVAVNECASRSALSFGLLTNIPSAVPSLTLSTWYVLQSLHSVGSLLNVIQ